MKKWGIIGALLFAAACVVGYIFKICVQEQVMVIST